MVYNMSLLDFKGRETELRVYPSVQEYGTVRCDEDGVILPRYFYSGEPMENPFTGEMERIKDLDEMEERKLASERSSYNRTKSKVYQLCRGEEWEWFLTFTFSPDVCDRHDYEECSRLLANWLHYWSRRHRSLGYDWRYMVVPEPHKDGAWHYHGLFSGLCPALLGLYRADGHEDYRVRAWKNGFSTAEPVRDELAVSNYISKYVTKDMITVTAGRKRYWASRNLAMPVRYNMNVLPKYGPMCTSMQLVDLFGEEAYISQAETPNGRMTYIQMRLSVEEVLRRIARLDARRFLIDVEQVEG